MEHFKQQDWVDFVRNTLEPVRTADINAHLADGCESCRATASGWQAIVNLASRLRMPGPPEEAVKRGKAAHFLLPASQPWMETVQFAMMSFDSLFAPVPASVRSAPGARHWVYQSGNYTIEFHIGACLEVNKAFLAGQIADSSEPLQAFGAADIKLVHNGSVTAQTNTNAFGEFTLEFQHEESLWLLVESPERPPIAVPLPDPAT